MQDIYERIRVGGVLPVVSFFTPEEAVPTCRALEAGGINAVEITFRTEAAAEAIYLVRQTLPGFLVGAGSILTPDMAQTAIMAGAEFLVTPGFSAPVVEMAISRGVPIFPGCSNASDLMAASAYPLNIVKFFPAEALGGLPMLKALSAPFPKLTFMPTGGLTLDNFTNYLASPKVFACGGSWLVKPAWLEEENYDAIREAARRTRDKLDLLREART